MARTKTKTATKECKYGPRDEAGNCPKKPRSSKSSQPKKRRVLRDNIQSITKPAMKRLSLQAGVKYMSGLNYEELRGILKVALENVLRRAHIYRDYAKRTRVTISDIGQALKDEGQKVYGYNTKNFVSGKKTETPERARRCKIDKVEGTKIVKTGGTSRSVLLHRGDTQIKKIRAYQGQNCLHLPRASFLRLVKEISQDFSNDEIQHQAAAVDMLQEYAEAYLRTLLTDSQLAAIHAHRQTVMPKDMQLVRRIKGERN